MNKSIKRLQKPIQKFNLRWRDEHGTLDLVHYVLAKHLPHKNFSKVYELCEVAFPSGGRYHAVKLKLWALVPEATNDRVLPFEREKCERFIVAFFESHLSLMAHFEISKCAKKVVEQAHKEGFPESSLHQLMHAELAEVYADYDKPLRAHVPKKMRRWLEEEGRMVGTKFTILYLGACARIGLAATPEMAPPEALELSEALPANIVRIEDFRKRN